jgi:hypothetical protein
MPRDLLAPQSQGMGQAPAFEPGMDSGYTKNQIIAEQYQRARGGRPSPNFAMSDENLGQLLQAQIDNENSPAPAAPPEVAPRDLLADWSPETAFAGLSPEQRSALAVEKLGPPEPASGLEVAGNTALGAGAAVGDIPAGIAQLSALAG